MFLKPMSLNAKTKALLNTAVDKRKCLQEKTNAVRLVNGVGDGLEGFVLEQYKDHFVAQVFDPFWVQESGSLKDYLLENFKVDYFIVKDRTGSSSSNPEAIKFQILVQNIDSKTTVVENGLHFEVDLNDTLNTGLFLDMRANRLLVAKSCKEKRVLNCFSYTCSFGSYARVHGASEVINVDVSKKILEKGKRNYSLNQITERGSEFIRADAVEYLEKAMKKNNQFDVIILDPPSFSRAEGKVFSVEKHLPKLIGSAVKVLKDKGKIFVATNFSVFHQKKLVEIFRDSCSGIHFKKIISLGQDQDFVGSGQSKESHLAALWAERS